MERRKDVDQALGKSSVDLILSEIKSGRIKDNQVKQMALAMNDGAHGVFVKSKGEKDDLHHTMLYVLGKPSLHPPISFKI